MNALRSRSKRTGNPLLDRGESAGTDSSASTLLKDPIQVEPKTYFANERTFIQWISAALLLLTVSSIMMGSGNFNGTSSLIAFSSLVLVVYAAFVYFRRVSLLRSGQPYGYLDFIGPSILAMGVGVGVLIVFADAVKGSEFLPFGKGGDNKDKDDDDRRHLLAAPQVVFADPTVALHEQEGACVRHTIQGINLLEYQPRDVLLVPEKEHPSGSTSSHLLVATPQALISHDVIMEQGRRSDAASKLQASEILDVQLESVTLANGKLYALSTGPFQTELLSFVDDGAELASRVVLQNAPSRVGSVVFVPSDNENGNRQGKLYIYLDGTMHTYQLDSPTMEQDEGSSMSVTRTGSINMKVLNRGGESHPHGDKDPILAIEHFEGVTYLLRSTSLEAWDLQTAAFLSQMDLPAATGQVQNVDNWVGLALERQEGSPMETTNLRHSREPPLPSSSVLLHMSLDSFPPQLWSFRMTEAPTAGPDGHARFYFPACVGGTDLN